MPLCSIELSSLVPGDMHECLPALPAAPQHVVLMHHSCMSLHVPRQLNITYGHLGDIALSTVIKQGVPAVVHHTRTPGESCCQYLDHTRSDTDMLPPKFLKMVIDDIAGTGL